MSNHKQFGFAHVGLLALFLLVVGVAGFIGWRVWQNGQEDSPTLSVLASPCEGRLYDSHAHPDDDAVVETLPELMSKYDIGCSVLFTQMDLNNIGGSLLQARDRYAGMPGRISIFYDVIKGNPSEVTRDKLDKLYKKSEGKFAGLGEFAFYEQTFRGTSLTDPGWSTIFEFAGEKGLVVMIHPQHEMVPSLETMLARYPNTKVLVHGFELPNLMGDLLKRYDNLYYTLDTTTMFTLGSGSSGDRIQSLFYPGGGPGVSFDTEAFTRDYDAKREQILSEATELWLPVLLAAPEKVLWGTDISMEGHVNAEVYKRIIDITDAFLEEMPEQYRQGYLRDNAFNLLGGGATLTPLSNDELDQLDELED